MRPQRNRDKRGNGRKLSAGFIPWIARRLAEGALPVIGTELGRVIWAAVGAGAIPWLYHWVFG